MNEDWDVGDEPIVTCVTRRPPTPEQEAAASAANTPAIGDLADPDFIVVDVLRPDKTRDSLAPVHQVDAVGDALPGCWQAALLLTQPGTWRLQWLGIGGLTFSEPQYIDVRALAVPTAEGS